MKANASKRLLMAAAAAAVFWHLTQLLTTSWPNVKAATGANDFTSFYYAAKTVRQGGDPYDTREMRWMRHDEQPRLKLDAIFGKSAPDAPLERDHEGEPPHGGLYPYLYPPPFLLFMGWTHGMDLQEAYRTWFWIDEVLFVAALLGLWRLLRRVDRDIGWIVVVGGCLALPFLRNRYMGQMNVATLAVSALGLWQVEVGTSLRQKGHWRQMLGGALVGVGCLIKLSPAIFGLWWLLRRQWRPIAGAALAGAALTGLSILSFGLDVHLRFVGEVLPGLGEGRYHDLGVAVSHWNNLSYTSLLHDFLIESVARPLSVAIGIFLLVGVFYVCQRFGDDGERGRVIQLVAVASLILVIPAYRFQHHLVWALPAFALTSVAVWRGWLGLRWIAPLAFAWSIWAYDIASITRIASDADAWPLLGRVFLEIKLAAMLILLAASVRLVAKKEALDPS